METGNTSGTHGPVPQEVRDLGWCWGGFALTWIWGLSNRVWLSCVAPLGPAVFGVGIWLGLRGHELAWQNRQFADLDQFRETMAVWNRVGRVAFLVEVVTVPLLVFFALALLRAVLIARISLP